jgi:hypothetical protein
MMVIVNYVEKIKLLVFWRFVSGGKKGFLCEFDDFVSFPN